MARMSFEERAASVEQAVNDLRGSLNPHFFRYPDHIGYSVPTEELRDHLADFHLAKIQSYEVEEQRHYAAQIVGAQAVGGVLSLKWVKLIEHLGGQPEQTYDYVAFYSNDLMADKKSLRKNRIPIIASGGRDPDVDWIEFELSAGHSARLVNRRLDEIVRDKRLQGEVIEIKNERHKILDELNEISKGEKADEDL